MIIGSIPNSICLLSSLKYFYVTNSGSNSGLICAPYCLTSVTNRTVPSTVCVYPQDTGLCGLIAATNIQSLSSQWSCTTGGYTTTFPCTPYYAWSGLSCSGVNVVSVSFSLNKLITGMCWNEIKYILNNCAVHKYIYILNKCLFNRYYSI